MEFVIRVLLFFTCLSFQDFVFCQDYAEAGGLITFSPSIRGKPVEILWKHNGDKVVEYDGSEMNQFGLFKDRVVIDFETGQLTINKLTSQDSGQYQSDITINGEVQSSRYTLSVLDVLPAPRVTCEVNKTSNLQELLCSVDYKTPLQYKWSGPNVVDLPGPKLIISEQQKNSDSVYSCTVKNEVSSKTTDFNLQDCVTGAAARLDVILPVLFAIILLIFLIILVIFIYKKKKPRKPEQNKRDPENPSSGAPSSCQVSLISPKDSDEIQDEDNGLDYTSENEEQTKLLNKSVNKEEHCSNPNSRHAVLEEEITSNKPDEMQMVMQKDRHLEKQDEEEEGPKEKLAKGIEMGESVKDENKKLEEQKTYNAENNGKIPGEKKEENKEEKDEQNTASSETTFPNQTRVRHENGADNIQDEDNRSDNTGVEKAKPVKDSGHEEQQDSNENSRHADVVEENANSKPEETQNQKLQESQEKEKKGEGEKLGNGNKKEENSMNDLVEKLRDLNIDHTNNNDKISEDKIKEENKEPEDQKSTELSAVPQNSDNISTAEPSNNQKHKEENQKAEKRNEGGELSAQQQNESVKTEETAGNEDQQTTGANTQQEDHEEKKESDTGSSPHSDVKEKDKEGTGTGGTLDKMENNQNKHEPQTAEDEDKRQEGKHNENTESASDPEEHPKQSNGDALTSQSDCSADTDNKSVKPDDNNKHNDGNTESLTNDVKSEDDDDNNGQGDKNSEPNKKT